MDYSNFLSMSHEISLVVVMALVLLVDLFIGDKNKKICQIAAMGLFLAHTVLCFTYLSDASAVDEAFGGMYVNSEMAVL